MSFRPLYGWILGLTAVTVFLGGLAVQSRMETPQTEAVAFVTLGLDQSQLPNESSSYEIQRAVEHFSDVVLGWTVEPSFAAEFDQVTGGGFEFSARRQEKQNLLFTVTGPVNDFVPAQELVDLLKQRLAEYNTASHSGYVVAVERESLVEAPSSSLRPVAGVTILVLLVEAFVLLGFDYARRR